MGTHERPLGFPFRKRHIYQLQVEPYSETKGQLGVSALRFHPQHALSTPEILLRVRCLRARQRQAPVSAELHGEGHLVRLQGAVLEVKRKTKRSSRGTFHFRSESRDLFSFQETITKPQGFCDGS